MAYEVISVESGVVKRLKKLKKDKTWKQFFEEVLVQIE